MDGIGVGIGVWLGIGIISGVPIEVNTGSARKRTSGCSMRKPRLGNHPGVPMSVTPYIHLPDALRPSAVNILPIDKTATIGLRSEGLAQSTSLLTTTVTADG